LQRLLPREEGFFDLFAKQSENIVVGAKALQQMLSHYTGVPEQVQIIKAIEHQGDEINARYPDQAEPDFHYTIRPRRYSRANPAN